MSLSRTVSEINGDFSPKSQIFYTTGECNVSAVGDPLESGTGAWSRNTRVMWLLGPERSFDNIFSRLTDGRTDRQIDQQIDRQTDTD